jgi:hypothetical protein
VQSLAMASAGRFALAHSCLVRAGGAELWLPHASSEACHQAALSPVAHPKLSCPFWLPPDAAHSFVNTKAAARLQAAASGLPLPAFDTPRLARARLPIARLHAPTEFKNYASDMHPNFRTPCQMCARFVGCMHMAPSFLPNLPGVCMFCGVHAQACNTVADAFLLYFIFFLSCISHYLSPAHPTTATRESSSHLRALAGQGRPLTSADIC